MMHPPKKRNVFSTKIDLVEQEIREMLNRSARNKLDRPTSEMPGKHQPSAFGTEIFRVSHRDWETTVLSHHTHT